MNKFCLSIATSLAIFSYQPIFGDEIQDNKEVGAAIDQLGTINVDRYILTKSDALPVESFETSADLYLEGYIQALIDIHYSEFDVAVTVKDHKVYLKNLPKNELLANSILAFVKDLPGVEKVEVSKAPEGKEMDVRAKYAERPKSEGIWFPQATVLFAPLIADPREPTYSVAYRFGDKVIGKSAASVAIGDDFPLYRWRNVWHWKGDLQVGIQACVWAVFNYEDVPKHDDGQVSELVNADYFVGIPFTYAINKWSFRFRVYHQSSHLGDEFLCNNPDELFERKNPSYEAVDFVASFQSSQALRLYAGPGCVMHSDPSFKLKPLYVMWGGELRLFGHKIYSQRLYGTPFLAIFIENWEQRHWNMDSTFKLGYELSKLQGIGRKFRVFVTYHTGYSEEGQFFNERTQYGEVGFSWGF